MLMLLVPFKVMLGFHPSFKHGNHSGDPEPGKTVAQALTSPCSAPLLAHALVQWKTPVRACALHGSFDALYKVPSTND